ncbi:FMN-binding negative transcriptional regulator [Microvirga antarctica]|uniref:FMN-binding negative transcriptional regulator n=1 Tax=Microvirga antarctica TaxID=2819233 RepID=UPI001B305BC1|nr:FMN-binding negative transcriptional regulator [Microvirga antarctica]
MYQPPHFREDRIEIQHALMRAHPLGMLVTLGADGLMANPIPFTLDSQASPHGTLKAHLSRANPQWRDVDESKDALVIFQGIDSYVTPSWYAMKRETGKVVPTWNYAIVQAYGPMIVRDDPLWVREQIGELTTRHEAGRAEPWGVTDAPADFVAAQIRGIVGIEIPIRRIEAKWKVSQNRQESDRRGVAEGLRAQGDEASLAMAMLVEAKGAAG